MGIETLVWLVVFLLVFGLVIYLVQLILSLYPIDPRFKTVILALVVLIGILVLLNQVGFIGSEPILHLRR